MVHSTVIDCYCYLLPLLTSHCTTWVQCHSNTLLRYCCSLFSVTILQLQLHSRPICWSNSDLLIYDFSNPSLFNVVVCRASTLIVCGDNYFGSRSKSVQVWEGNERRMKINDYTSGIKHCLTSVHFNFAVHLTRSWNFSVLFSVCMESCIGILQYTYDFRYLQVDHDLRKQLVKRGYKVMPMFALNVSRSSVETISKAWI